MSTHWLDSGRERRFRGAMVGSGRYQSRLMGSDKPKDKRSDPSVSGGPLPRDGEDLPYRVELWNAAKTGVEQVLAVTANASIGQAAFYAAAREFTDRYVTLRHKTGIVNRWNGPSH